jgi:phage FluMu protein Com
MSNRCPYCNSVTYFTIDQCVTPEGKTIEIKVPHCTNTNCDDYTSPSKAEHTTKLHVYENKFDPSKIDWKAQVVELFHDDWGFPIHKIPTDDK